MEMREAREIKMLCPECGSPMVWRSWWDWCDPRLTAVPHGWECSNLICLKRLRIGGAASVAA